MTEARWTEERGWRVLLACQPAGRLLERAGAAGIDARPVAMRSAWDARAVARLASLIKQECVSLVHTHSSIDAWVGGLAARAARVPVVRTRHVSIPIRSGWNPVYTWLADRVITSGDAIRALVVKAGARPDRVLAILARDALGRHPGAPIVFDVKCSRAVPDVIREAGGEPVMWMTGHSHIKTKMREISAPFAGERSGHFFDAGDYYGYDDAIYSALRFLKIVADSGRTVEARTFGASGSGSSSSSSAATATGSGAATGCGSVRITGRGASTV